MPAKTIILIFAFLTARFTSFGQSSPPHLIKLKSFNTKSAIIYDRDSIKIYLQRDTFVKYLRLAFKKGPDTSYTVVLNALKHNAGKQFVIKDTLIYNTFIYKGQLKPYNYYSIVIYNLAPYLLARGKAMIYKTQDKAFIKSLYKSTDDGGDIIGAYEDLTFYYPDKRVFYKIKIRHGWWFYDDI